MHIKTEGLTRRYRRPALDRVSLDIAPGQIVALLGLNGAGKSTLLRCLAGMTAPSAGDVYYDGKPLRREDLATRRRLFYLPDFPMLLVQDTVLRNIAVVLRLYEADVAGAEDRVLALLEEFDMTAFAHTPPAQLSRGQAYKVGLICLLAVDPEVWLCDEPLASGMDPLGLAAYRRHVRGAAARGRTIIYSTQILQLAQGFSDRAIILGDGQLKGFDTLQNLAGAGEEGLEALFRDLREGES